MYKLYVKNVTWAGGKAVKSQTLGPINNVAGSEIVWANDNTTFFCITQVCAHSMPYHIPEPAQPATALGGQCCDAVVHLCRMQQSAPALCGVTQSPRGAYPSR